MKEEIIRKFATSYGPWLDYCTMRIGNFRIPKYIVIGNNIISELFKKLYYKSINKVDEIINTYYDEIFPTIEYRNSINRLTINYGSFSGMTNDEINCTDTMLRWIYGINLNIINNIRPQNPYICE